MSLQQQLEYSWKGGGNWYSKDVYLVGYMDLRLRDSPTKSPVQELTHLVCIILSIYTEIIPIIIKNPDTVVKRT